MKRIKTDRALWHRLEGYSFHERPLTRSLVDRLEEETGHPVDVCYTLVEEYRRFMYLVGSTGDELMPSPIVDIVWRLHVEDERAYFEDFCARVIGRTIYRPEQEGDADLSTPDDPAYIRTLEYYAQEFGRAQVQYWPDPDLSVMRLSHALFWGTGLAAWILAIVLKSYAFAVFGALIIIFTVFLRWQFTSLPLESNNREASAK